MLDYILGFFLIITPLVFFHELGHYILARLAQVRVHAFSIGFGPEILGFYDKNGTRWRFALIPLGGYVKMEDEAIGDWVQKSGTEPQTAQRTRSNDIGLSQASLASRMAIVSAGPLANIILAILIFLFLNLQFGIYKQADYAEQGIQVITGSPADLAGLQQGDLITRLNDVQIIDFQDIISAIEAAGNTPLTIEYIRGDVSYQRTVTPKLVTAQDGTSRYVLGVSIPPPKNVQASFIEATQTAMLQTYLVGREILYAIGGLIGGTVDYTQLGGPVKIAQYSGETLNSGLQQFLFFTAMLSINLAMINMFPIPGLDGGLFVIMVIEGIMGRRPPDKIVRLANNVGITFVLVLIVAITAKDIIDIMTQYLR